MELPVGNQNTNDFKTMDEAIKAHFISAWIRANGNVYKVIELLNISRCTVYRWTKKYGVKNDSKRS